MKAKLTPEERKLRASNAGKAMWVKRKALEAKAAELSATEEPTPPAAVVQEQPVAPQRPSKRLIKPLPKAFKGASSYAEKRLAQALKERAEYMGRVAALNAEIPSLVQVIRALGGNPNGSFAQPQAYISPPQETFVDPYQNLPNIDPALFQANSGPLPGASPIAPNAPLVPRTAGGGASDLDYIPVEEENPGLPKMGTGWI